MMEPANTFMRACEFARKAHEGQLDKAGEAYIWHPIAVADLVLVRNQGKTFEGFTLTDAIVAAYLHDTVEDCPGITLDLIEKEFGPTVRTIVDGVTRREIRPGRKETYMDFIKRAKKHEGSKIVKLADLEHNMGRIDNLPLAERDIIKRYERAKEELLRVDAPPPPFELILVKQGIEVLIYDLVVSRPDGTKVTKRLDFSGNATRAVWFGAQLVVNALNEI